VDGARALGKSRLILKVYGSRVIAGRNIGVVTLKSKGGRVGYRID
jgi:hypothetical protein